MALKGSALKGALAAAPSRGGRVSSLPVGAPPAQGLQRLSPGVYRNQQGQLVGSRGQSLPGQRPQQRPPVAMPAQAPTQQPQAPMQQQPMVRPPAPNMNPEYNNIWAGGSPNFNELTGQYNQQQYDTGFYDYMRSRNIGMPQVSLEERARLAAPANYGEQIGQQPMNSNIQNSQVSPQIMQSSPWWKGSF